MNKKRITSALSTIISVALIASVALLFASCSRTLSGDELYEKAIDRTFLIRAYSEQGTLESNSGGVVVGEGGIAATAFHCVSTYGGDYVAKFADGAECAIVELLAVDVKNDLAVVRLEIEDIEPVRISASDLPIGSDVYVLGNTKGYGFTLSSGLHSARKSDDCNRDIFQYTAAISGGNSGGPVFNANGELVAIVTSSFVEAENMSLGTPARYLADMLAQIRAESDEKSEDSAKPAGNLKTEGETETLWGQKLSESGTPFVRRLYDGGDYYYGEYANGSFTGSALYNDLEKYKFGSHNSYEGDFVEGSPKGYAVHEYKYLLESDAQTPVLCREEGEFGDDWTLTGKGIVSDGRIIDDATNKIYERGDMREGRLNGIGLYANADTGECWYGEWEDGEANGVLTYEDADGAQEAAIYENGEYGKPFRDALPTVSSEDITYRRLSDTTYNIDWEPVPGAVCYTLYYRLENEDTNDLTPILDENGDIKKFQKSFMSEGKLNTELFAPYISFPVGGEERFYVIVLPISSDEQYSEYNLDGFFREDADFHEKTVYTSEKGLKNGAYGLYSDYENAFSAALSLSGYGDGRNYLGLLSAYKNSQWSVFNEYGPYGAKTALRGVWNREGRYGSETSDYSAFNPQATHPPKIYDGTRSFVGYLTKNKDLQPAFDPDEIRDVLMAAGV
jgi:hypothetical protein